MVGRTCRVCREEAVHRAHREQWMRLLSYLVPIRPMQCHACRARYWTLMTRDRDAWQSWLVSGVLWFTLLSLLVGSVSQPLPGEVVGGPQGGEIVAEPDAKSLPETKSAPGAASLAAIEQLVTHSGETSGPEKAQKPLSVAETAQTTSKAYSSAPDKLNHKMLAVESSVDGKVLSVLLRASHAPFPFTRFESKAASALVLDIPGKWQLDDGMKQLYAFPTSNLQQIRFGLHKKFLRVVLILRRPKGGAQPKVTSTAEGLRVVVDG